MGGNWFLDIRKVFAYRFKKIEEEEVFILIVLLFIPSKNIEKHTVFIKVTGYTQLCLFPVIPDLCAHSFTPRPSVWDVTHWVGEKKDRDVALSSQVTQSRGEDKMGRL